MTKMTDLIALMVHANNEALDLAERQKAFTQADDIRKSLHIGWNSPKLGGVNVPTFTADIASTVAPEAGSSIAVPAKKGRAAKTEPVKAPLVAGTVVLRNAIQAALFTEAFLPELGENGKWAKTRPIDHAAPWLIAKVEVAADPKNGPVGITFEAPKTNYNLNDSNWTNEPTVTPKLLAIAQKANGGTALPKKAVVAELEDMKHIFMGPRIATVVKDETDAGEESPTEAEAEVEVVAQEPAAEVTEQVQETEQA